MLIELIFGKAHHRSNQLPATGTFLSQNKSASATSQASGPHVPFRVMSTIAFLSFFLIILKLHSGIYWNGILVVTGVLNSGRIFKNLVKILVAQLLFA
jgi:hypothetical protein